jgi:YfiH family protein
MSIAQRENGAEVKKSMIWKRRSGLELGIFPVTLAVAPQLETYFGSRRGGVSASPYDSLNIAMSVGDKKIRVQENRRRLLAATGIIPDHLARAGQVHGSSIAVVAGGGFYEGVDGLITAEKDLALAVSTADCYAVFVYAPSERVLAALHVGRSGAAGGIIESSLALMGGRFAADLRNCIALIGPGICRDCYEVGERHADPFPKRFRTMRRGRWHLDLLSYCRAELERGGMRSGNIYYAGLCTSCCPELFYSYRREGGITGRHWALARIRSRPSPL